MVQIAIEIGIEIAKEDETAWDEETNKIIARHDVLPQRVGDNGKQTIELLPHIGRLDMDEDADGR
jgi:hypothetical protein